MRKRYGDKLKAKVALEATKNEITIAELATKMRYIEIWFKNGRK